MSYPSASEEQPAKQPQESQSKPLPHEDALTERELRELPNDGLRYDTLWLNSLLRPVLITIMVGCINVAFIAFIARIWPGMPNILAAIMIITAGVGGLIGGYSTTILFQPDQRMRRFFGYRLAEIGLLIFLTRGITWTLVDGWPELTLLLYQPIDALVSLSFLLALIVVLIAWGISAMMTYQFLEMALKPDELLDRGDNTTSRFAVDSRVRSDRQRILTGFTEQWIGGGVFLLLLTASSQIESVGASGSPFIAIARQSIDPIVIGATMLYFLLGLGLLGIGRLAVLRARWQIESIPGAESVMRRWPLYTLALLAGVGLFALLLPIGSTFWLGRAVSAVLTMLYFIVYIFFGLLFSLFALLFPTEEGEQEPMNPMDMFVPPEEAAPAPPAELPAWIGGSLFWMIIGLMLFYAAYIYFSGKGFTFTWLKVWWHSLKARWLEFWDLVRSRSGNQFESTETTEKGSPLTWLSKQLKRIQLGRLTPTQRVRYFYLSMLDEAKDQGIPRRQSETPFHYAPRLEKEIEEERESIERLTNEFVQIHYAQKNATEETIPVLQQIWQQVRTAIHKQIRNIRSDQDSAKD